jgi:hypothetical protein
MCLFIPLTNARVFHNLVDLAAVLFPSLLLNFLFLLSTVFTESISGRKYPAYAAYQKRVAMFWVMDTWWKQARLWLVGDKDVVEALVWGEGVLGKKEE